MEGCSHIYAIGDCADVREPKMAYHAGLHANVAVANIVNARKQRPLKAYKPGEEAPGTSRFAESWVRRGEAFASSRTKWA